MTKIAFTGAGATGKTSLLSACMEDSFFDSYAFHESITRATFRKTGFISEHDQHAQSPQDNFGLQLTILNDKQVQQDSILTVGGDLISDRIMLDHFAYMMTRNLLHVDNDLFEKTSKQVLDNFVKYNIIFLFQPFKRVVEADGFRDVNYALSYTVNAIMTSYVDTMINMFYDGEIDQIPVVVTIPCTMSVEDRVQFMKDSIKDTNEILTL